MTPMDLLSEHAYELAFRACEGDRVAVLGERPDLAGLPPADGVELVGPEAIADGGNGAFDAVVLVRDGDERAPVDEALEPVRQFAARGISAVVALPCEPGDTGGARATREALESLSAKAGGVRIVELRRASGSLIAPADRDAAASFAGADAGEPEALVGFVNVDPRTVPRESLIRFAPASRRSLAAMEHSVGALERANRSLARPVASKRASAAASEVHRSTQLERRLLHLHRESPWVTQPIRIARGLARRLRALRARFSR